MSRPRCTLLLVDDEPYILRTLSALLEKEFDIVTASSAAEAKRILTEREIDLILTDQRMPGESGVQLLEWVRDHSPRTVRLIMTGLARIEDAVDAINCGQVHRYLFKPWRSDELLQIMRNAAHTYMLERSHEQLLQELQQLNSELEQRVQQRTRELEQANRQLQQKNSMLEKLALTDALTGLPNRRAMDRLARSELRRRQRYPSALALGIIDADHFKEINSRYLLPGGDHALVVLSQLIAGSIRTVDSVGRIGGEEFMVLAPETNFEGAVILGERIRSTVERTPIHYEHHRIMLTISIGVAVVDTHVPTTYAQMKRVAAAALEEAKQTGRNCCIVRRILPEDADDGPLDALDADEVSLASDLPEVE
ncbi:MAG: diguanylate cyclase [Gemmataceae bacterium]